MVKINFCPSCGAELIEKSFICSRCSLDIEELFAKGYLLASNTDENSIELFEGSEEVIVLDDEENPQDEIVIVVPQEDSGDELVIDFDELGIDVENICEDINIVIEVDGVEFSDDEYIQQPTQWFFDDDPYCIVYYQFIKGDD